MRTGKSGTVTPEEFEQLASLVENYGARLLAQKVGKACSRVAKDFTHEFPTSSVGAAWNGSGSRIVTSLGAGTRPITKDGFNFLVDLVGFYGPEVVLTKIAKLAKKSGNLDEAAIIKNVFPVTTQAA